MPGKGQCREAHCIQARDLQPQLHSHLSFLKREGGRDGGKEREGGRKEGRNEITILKLK